MIQGAVLIEDVYGGNAVRLEPRYRTMSCVVNDEEWTPETPGVTHRFLLVVALDYRHDCRGGRRGSERLEQSIAGRGWRPHEDDHHHLAVESRERNVAPVEQVRQVEIGCGVDRQCRQSSRSSSDDDQCDENSRSQGHLAGRPAARGVEKSHCCSAYRGQDTRPARSSVQYPRVSRARGDRATDTAGPAGRLGGERADRSWFSAEQPGVGVIRPNSDLVSDAHSSSYLASITSASSVARRLSRVWILRARRASITAWRCFSTVPKVVPRS